MTKACVEKVNELNQSNPEFADLSIEQLLYAAIEATSQKEVYHTLTTTNWLKWLPEEKW